MKWTGGAVLLAGILALTGCSGSKGSDGASGPIGPQGDTGSQGPAGQDGADASTVAKAESCEVCHKGAGAQHQAVYNSFKDGIDPATTKFAASIVSVVTSPGTNTGTFKSTVTLTLSKGGVPYTGAASTLKQKTMYFVTYDAAANKFPTPPYVQGADVDPTGEVGGSVAGSAVNFSYGSLTLKDAATGTYTMVKDNLTADPATAPNAFVYGYFGDAVLPGVAANTNTNRHYAIMDNMVSVAKVLNGTIPYASTAKVSGCEKCHGAPYSKHGYRQASVSGLADFVACKACHTDFRRGTDGAWYLLADDPATLAAQGGTITDAQKAKYAYVATVMQDTHNSHAFEFAYPQSMANCTTCHEGHLAEITANANFRLSTCKSCHPVTGTNADPKRAPALKALVTANAGLAAVHSMDLYSQDPAVDTSCTTCHGAIAGIKTFAQIHSGRDAAVYKADGSKYAASVKAQVDSAAFDSATNKLTVNFSVAGGGAGVKPTVVVSLYGYDTKDFIVSGHGSQPAPDGKRNLEWTEGASGNSPRLTVVAGSAAASWVATADLTTWASLLADGTVKRVEVAILPSAGVDLTKAPQNDPAKAAYNPYIAVAGVSKTFDLGANALVADDQAYGRAIVSADKCNKCHEALGTTFHSPSYGSAGVLGCRTCHVVGSGGSHLEMQSRSIDSYVHAIHSFQPFDVKNIDFSNPLELMRYEHHVESVYPNFMIQNCESCHNAGTYEAPDQAKSLPSILSAAAVNASWGREIGTVGSVVVGAGSRACGSCHRATLINEDDAGSLAALNQHTASFGTYVPNSDSSVFQSVIDAIRATFK